MFFFFLAWNFAILQEITIFKRQFTTILSLNYIFLLLGCYLISIQNLIFTLEITRVLNWVFFLDICLPKPFSSSSANTFVGKSGFKNYLSPVEKKNKSCKNRQKSNYFNPHPEYSQNNLGIRILISITNLGQEIFQGHF